jgi:hypothetical protein
MNKLALATLLACATITGSWAAGQASQTVNAGQASSSMSGTLTANSGKFFLTDDVTRVTVEVQGEGLSKYVGQKVNLSGSITPAPAAGSPEILIVSSVSRKAAVAASKTAPAGVKAGLSKGAVVGLAGGATAATVGTLYAAGGGEETPVSRR